MADTPRGTGQLAGVLARVRADAAYGLGLVVDGPVGTDPTALLAQARDQLRDDFATIISAAPSPGPLGLICDAFGGTDLADDLRAALRADGDPLALPQLHGALTRWVTDLVAAGQGPIMLLCTEVHHCDPSSVRVLEMATRRPIPGLVTMLGGRRGRTMGQLLASAAPQDRIPLEACTLEEFRAGRPELTPVRVEALWQAAEGLPAFAGALAALPLPTVRAIDRLGVGELADLVDDDQVRQWCGSPDERSRLVLVSAAAGGMRVDVERVAEASGVPPIEVQRIVTAAQEDGLLRDRDGALRFGHPLLRGACYRLVGPAAREEIHRSLAWTAPAPADGCGDDDLEHRVAVGRFESNTVERILEGSERWIRDDPPAAARALGALWNAELLDPAQRAQAGLAFAHALEALGAINRARGMARQLMGDPLVRMEATLLAARCERVLGHSAAAQALVIGSGAHGASAHVLVELAAIAAIDPHQPPVAEQAGCNTVPAVMLLAAIRAERWPGDADMRACAVEALEAASGVLDGLDQTTYSGLVEHVPGFIQALIRLGFTDAARYQLTRASTLARHRVDISAQLHLLAALLEVHGGRLTSAVDHCDEALELARCAELPRLHVAADAVRALARGFRGEPELSARLREFVVDDVTDPWLRLTAQTLVEYCLVAEDYPRARELLLRLGWVGALSGDASVLQSLRAVTELRLGNVDEARDAVAAAESMGHSIGERARVAEAAAAVALAAEQFDLAQADARIAVRLHGRAGAVLAEARSRVLLAECLRASGDLTGAEREAGLAKSTFAGIGAGHLSRRVVSVQKRIAATASRGLRAGEFGLSPREAEIAHLVCGGLTNREIGSKLYLSVRTVDTHVARVLSKVGVGSRVALARMFMDAPVAV